MRSSRSFPQEGGCLCGDARYRLAEDPVMVYACHCTDCQTETGTAFSLSTIVRREALELLRGQLEEFSCRLRDGRTKSARYCPRCVTKLWGLSSVSGLANLEAGTLDDTSWLRPAGHIWTRSAQPWIRFGPSDRLFDEQPDDAGLLALVRGWKHPDGEPSP